jgi:hypothetical protein
MRMKKSRRARGKRPSANTYERPWGSERRLGRERERESKPWNSWGKIEDDPRDNG